MKRFKPWCFCLVSALWSDGTVAHAYPERSSPGVDQVLGQAPTSVTIVFDSELEPVFSKMSVDDARGRQVSLGESRIDPADHKSLWTKLSPIGKGAFHVYWDVVSRDGHRSSGDYVFTVK